MGRTRFARLRIDLALAHGLRGAMPQPQSGQRAKPWDSIRRLGPWGRPQDLEVFPFGHPQKFGSKIRLAGSRLKPFLTLGPTDCNHNMQSDLLAQSSHTLLAGPDERHDLAPQPDLQ